MDWRMNESHRKGIANHPDPLHEFNASGSARPLNNEIADADLKGIQRDMIGFKLGQLSPAFNPQK